MQTKEYVVKGSHSQFSSAKYSSQFKSIGNGLKDPDALKDNELEQMHDLNMIVGGNKKVYEMPVKEESVGAITERVSMISEQPDPSMPHLKPKDLEDLALIFDRIRVLYKKREDNSQKLIAKG